jgi:hypothetical protein
MKNGKKCKKNVKKGKNFVTSFREFKRYFLKKPKIFKCLWIFWNLAHFLLF